MGAKTSLPSDRILLAGVLLFTVLVYLPALRYDFVYDDQGQIVDNVLVQAWRYVPEYFQGHVWAYLYPNAPANYYRPINVLWFRINHALFDLRPIGWHASTIVLHLLATALTFAIVRRITARPLVAAWAALLFGIHPTRHEVVAWVSGSTESLCAVLFLSSFLAYLISREKRPIVWMSASCVLYAAGLLAKETAIVLPGLVLAHCFLYGTRQAETAERTLWQRFLPAAARASVYIPLVILYLVLRVHALHGFSHPQNVVPVSTLLLTLPSVLFFYWKQWLLPIHISEFYDLTFRTRWGLLAVMLPLSVLAGTGALLWYLRRKLGAREVAFGATAMLLTLMPVLYVSVFPAGELVHDRYAYLPGVGAALVVALAIQPLCKGRLVFRLPRRLVFASLAVMLPLSYGTANASSYWVDELTLFEHAHRMAPQNVLARNNYAVELAHNGQQGTAITMLQKLVDERPGYFLANYNLGRLLYEMNLIGAADHYLQRARNIQPDRPDAYLQLGLVAMKTGRLDQAVPHFRHATALQPRDATIHFALGVALAGRGECVEARSEFSEALMLKPGFTKAQEQTDKCDPARAEGGNLPAVGGLPARPAAPRPNPADRATIAPVKGS